MWIPSYAAKTRSLFVAGNGLSYLDGTYKADTTVLSTKNNVTALLLGYAPITGGTGYIRNQSGSNLSAQTGKFYVTDTIKSNGPVIGSYVAISDVRYDNTGYITYDVLNTGTAALNIRRYSTNVLSFNSIGAATFSQGITASSSLAVNGTFTNLTGSTGYSALTVGNTAPRSVAITWDDANSRAAIQTASNSFPILIQGSAVTVSPVTTFSNNILAGGQVSNAGYAFDNAGTTRLQGATTINSGTTINLPAVSSSSYLQLSSATASSFNTYLGTTANNQYAWFTNIKYNGSAFVKDNVGFSAWRLNQAVGNLESISSFNLDYFPVGSVSNSTFLSIWGSGETVIGSSTTSGAKLTTNGSITASSAIARGVYFNNTLIAAANNDVLVGLDINPTFTNGAFTGVSNYAARFQNSALITNANNGPTSLRIANSTSGTAASVRIYFDNNSGSSLTQIGKLSSAYTATAVLNPSDYFLYNQNAGNITLWNNTSAGTINFTAGGATTVQMVLFGTGNLGVNQNTDAGYKLDINGTLRVQGAITGTSSITAGTNGSDANVYLLGYNSSDTRITSNSGSTSSYNGVSIVTNRANSNSLPAWAIDLGGNQSYLTNPDAFAVGRKASGGAWTNFLTISSTGAATFSNTITTAAPSVGTAQPWKLGNYTSGGLTTTGYLYVEINGQMYSIPCLLGTP